MLEAAQADFEEALKGNGANPASQKTKHLQLKGLSGGIMSIGPGKQSHQFLYDDGGQSKDLFQGQFEREGKVQDKSRSTQRQKKRQPAREPRNIEIGYDNTCRKLI